VPWVTFFISPAVEAEEKRVIDLPSSAARD
jgi:hypothetical protein